jgi:hypothetical protein
MNEQFEKWWMQHCLKFRIRPGFVTTDSKLIAERSWNAALESVKSIYKYETLLFKKGAMLDAPCFVCGYNGPGYFNSDIHPCANKHHKYWKG